MAIPLSIVAPLALIPIAFFSYKMVVQISSNKCDKFVCQDKCKEGYKNRLGFCFQTCGNDQVDMGALCRQKCKMGYKDVAGVCWLQNCPPGETKVGTVCYKPCASNQKDVGLLCRDRCRKDFREVLGVCWKGFKSYVPKTSRKKSDAKLASYVPKSAVKKSYAPTTKFGNKYLLPGYAALMIVMVGVLAYAYQQFTH
jgi:hypothetical protein